MYCLQKHFSIRTKIARARFRLKPQIETFTRFLFERLERIGFGYCHHSFWWIHYKDNTGCQGFNKLQFPSLAFLILTYLCWSVLKLHTYNDYARTHVLSLTHTHYPPPPPTRTHTHSNPVISILYFHSRMYALYRILYEGMGEGRRELQS